MRESLEDDRRAKGHPVARMVVRTVERSRVPRPAPPPGHGVVEALVDLFRLDGLRTAIQLLGPRRDERQPDPLAAPNGERATDLMPTDLLQLGVAPDHEAVVTAHRGPHLDATPTDPWRELPVVEARRHRHLQLHVARHALDHTDQLAVGIERAAAARREAVEDTSLAAGRLERGGQHQGAVEVLAARVPSPLLRLDGAIAPALPVEQSAEAAPRVETRRAAPVDRAGLGNEGGRVEVANQRVVPDGGISAHSGIVSGGATLRWERRLRCIQWPWRSRGSASRR